MKHLGKTLVLLSALLLCGLSATAMAGTYPAGYWQYPAIKGYGPVHPRPNAAMQPDKQTIYKVVFNVTAGSKDMSKPNPGLGHVARAVNVFASAGVPLDHLRFVAVVHGAATASVLDDKALHAEVSYRQPQLETDRGSAQGRRQSRGLRSGVVGAPHRQYDRQPASHDHALGAVRPRHLG